MTSAAGVATLPMYPAYVSSFLQKNGTTSGMKNAIPLVSQSTTTTGMASDTYASALPRNLDIFSEVEQGLINPAISDDQRLLARKLVLALKANLLRDYRYKYMDLPYSELHLNMLEDSSVLIEWTYLNLRAGFSIENRVDESSYYVLLRDREDGVSTIVPEYGPLTSTNIGTVAKKVVARISERL